MLIDAQADMQVVGEAHDGREAVRMARDVHAHVVLLDITMPGGGGLQAISDILNSGHSTKVLLLTMHDDPAYLRTALAAGASGYVLKKSVDADLLAAIRAVSQGRKYVDAELANTLIDEAVPEFAASEQSGTKVLSDREVQVLKLVAEGFSSREIAEQIFVSNKTVETYRSRFAEKLGLRSRADIVRYALEMGLLSSETFSTPRQRRK
jgi:two-component system, NarL family, response regulator NreC